MLKRTLSDLTSAGAVPPAAPAASGSANSSDAIIASHRRQGIRLAVTGDDGIEMRLWRIGPHDRIRDQPPPSQSFRCVLSNLSVRGLAAVVWAVRLEAMRLSIGQRFRIELTAASSLMIFDARLQHPPASSRDDASALCGFEFLNADKDIEARRSHQKLDRLLGMLQRKSAQQAAERKAS